MLKRLDADKADRSAYHEDQSESGNDRPEISQTGRNVKQSERRTNTSPACYSRPLYLLSFTSNQTPQVLPDLNSKGALEKISLMRPNA
jgi:hypothetical protein